MPISTGTSNGVQTVTGTVTSIQQIFSTQRSDTYTGTTTGVVIPVTSPVKTFAIQVKGTGAAASVWTVLLEGSIDGTNYTTIMTHTNILGEVILWSGTNFYPVLYFRSRVTALTLGSATDISVTILGTS